MNPSRSITARLWRDWAAMLPSLHTIRRWRRCLCAPSLIHPSGGGDCHSPSPPNIPSCPINSACHCMISLFPWFCHRYLCNTLRAIYLSPVAGNWLPVTGAWILFRFPPHSNRWMAIVDFITPLFVLCIIKTNSAPRLLSDPSIDIDLYICVRAKCIIMKLSGYIGIYNN